MCSVGETRSTLFYCISSGSISQNNVKFGNSKNSQCVCISVCASTAAQWDHISRGFLTSEQIDEIVEQGDTYYKQTKILLGPSHTHRYLYPQEVAPIFTYLNESFSISISWIVTGTYPNSEFSQPECETILAGHFEEQFAIDSDCGYIFLGLYYAVAVWKCSNKYFVFNSHSVKKNGLHSVDGVARLFCSNTLQGLARLLLVNYQESNEVKAYEIHKVVSTALGVPADIQINQDVNNNFNVEKDKNITVNFSPKDVCTESNNLNLKKRPGRPIKPRAGRPRLSSFSKEEHFKDVEIDMNQNTELDKIPGRPVKPNRGRPRVSHLTNEEQHSKAVKRYTTKRPEVHRTAVKTYTVKCPEVNQKAVKKYKKSHPGRHLPSLLGKGLICEYWGDKLNLVQPFELKNPSLKANDCFKCSNCNSRLFEEERSRAQWCCGQGRFNVLDLPPISAPFYDNSNFKKHSRRYNDIFAFCALEIPAGYHHPRRGISFLKIQGRVYHKVYDLLSRCSGTNRGFMYIDDGEQRLEQAIEKKLNITIIKSIQEFLTENNPFILLYKQLYNEPSDKAHLIFESTTRRTHGPVLGDRPQSREVAAVLSCESEPYTARKLCVWKKGAGKPNYIYAFHPLIEPLQYPLLYPQGTPGWHINRKDNTGRKLSQLKYTRCLLLSEDRFSKFGRLSETWLVDMFSRIDEERLRYIQFSQKTGVQKAGVRIAPVEEVIAVVDQQKVMDDVTNDETVQGDGPVVPGRIYLPQSYTGGPRYMRVSYMDSMALVSRCGNPTYFLTFTAYGGWKEIKESRQNSTSEAHIINRVFQIKLLELLRDIRCGSFFGKMSYVVWVIEFQMRGLPHAHICFRVDGGGPIQSHEIDGVIRADIPKVADAEGRLRTLVLKHMIHGPCGNEYRIDFACWDGELHKCSKFYPKPHTQTTHSDERGFIHYRRNSENKGMILCKKNPVEVDDRWVVPYNAALLLKYECHVNLEIASARRVIKYLFKYISKGSSLRRMTVMQESQPENEVEEYVTKRYIGASDAAWRILEFDVTGREPTVTVLPVHLEGKHVVIFNQGEEREALATASSRLLLYFNRPKVEEMDNLNYLEFYEQFIVHSKKPSTKNVLIYNHCDGVHFITARQRGSCVARLFWVAPSRGEQYFLRMILTKYPCRSYQDLYALGGPHCTTFQQAAVALGLADNNKEYVEAMKEASNFMNAERLRQFFVILCTIGAGAAELWENFNCFLCEDFLHDLTNDSEKALKLGLIQIDRCLRRHGSCLFQVGLPVVEDSSTELGRERLQYSVALQRKFVEDWEYRLSVDQLQVFQHMKLLFQGEANNLSKVLFVDGPGGYGKTMLLKVIAAYFRGNNKVVLCVATSGIAALNLNGGTTAHSMFRLPLDLKDGTEYWSITNGSQRAELIREAAVIIFDEVPMAHKHLIEMVDRSLKDLMQSNELFGAKIVIFAGDFRQIPPVVENARSSSDVINSSLRRSFLWSSLKFFTLNTPHRTGSEDVYAKFLLELGANLVTERAIEDSNSNEVLVPLRNINYVTTVKALIEFVFPNSILKSPDECAKRAVLCNHNRNVKEVNDLVTSSLVGEYEELFSFDSVAEGEGTECQVDDALLHHAQGKGVPDHILKLKIGSVCMITRNLNFDMGLVNGTKVIIQAISRRLITVRRPDSNEHFGIPRISFKFPIFPRSPIEMMRRQFPLQPCYAISVHKSQGQTIDVVGFDLRSDCFAHGQLYVGLSRVRSAENLCVLVPSHRVFENMAHTKNIVHKELI